MAIKFKKTKNTFTRGLGLMVGLLLSLYVFDQVLAAVVPNFCSTTATCIDADCTFEQYNASQTADEVCQYTNATHRVLTGPDSEFNASVTFVDNLFPVLGILAAFEIILLSLRRGGLAA